MNGTIQGEKVSNVEIPLDLVEKYTKDLIPDASTSNMATSDVQPASNNIGPNYRQ